MGEGALSVTPRSGVLVPFCAWEREDPVSCCPLRTEPQRTTGKMQSQTGGKRMEIPAARGAVHSAVLPLPWEKELKSPFQVTGWVFWSSGVETQPPSLPVQ